MALDWKRAFDSINPQSMIAGLKRFGLTDHVLGVISFIYADRVFKAHDCGHDSFSRRQHSGMSQGCALSPLLFVMLMTVLMKDASEKLSEEDQQRLQNVWPN